MLAALMRRPLGNNLRGVLHFRQKLTCFALGQEEKKDVLCRNPPRYAHEFKLLIIVAK